MKLGYSNAFTAADHLQQHVEQAGAAGCRARNSLAQLLQQQCSGTQLRRLPSPRTQLSAFKTGRTPNTLLYWHVPNAMRQQLAVAERLQSTHSRSVTTTSSSDVLQPDPAADDLDMLVAQAATVVPCINTPNSSEGRSTTFASPSARASRPSTPFSRVRTASAVQPNTAAIMSGSRGAPCGVVQQPLRYTTADKLCLTEAEARDIARRLRTPRAPQPGQPVLRVFRYGIDDLRLYKAIDAAGLEGRVVVVDALDFADAVITTFKKRTGKNVNQAVAKRAAAGAGVPCFVLKAVSAEKLVEALGQMLRLPKAAPPSSMKEDSMQRGQPQEQQSAAGEPVAQQIVAFAAPRQLRPDEVEGDSFQQLLQLLWGPGAVRKAARAELVEGSGSTGGSGGGNGHLPSTPRWEAWHASQSLRTVQDLFELVKQIDVEDSRDHMLPANPNARAGERYKLMKPMRHSSRLRRKLLNKDLAAKQAQW